MKDKTILILIFISALTLALAGYFIVHPITFVHTFKDNNVTIISNEKLKTNSYSVKISTKENTESNNLININLEYNKDDKKVTFEFDTNFDKASEILVNEEEIYNDEVVTGDEELKGMIDNVIEKIKKEKLYNIDKLSMTYYSSYSSNK